MSFRRSAKIKGNAKMEFTLIVDCIVGLPTASNVGGAPKFHVEYERGSSIKGQTKPFSAIVDAPRAMEMLPGGLGSVPPTIAEVDFKTTFDVTLQRKTDFSYKPKNFRISVMDTKFGSGVIGGELNLGSYVDREYLAEKTFEVMNKAQDKCLIFRISAELQKDAHERRKAEAAKAKEAPKSAEPDVADEGGDSPSHTRRDEHMQDERRQMSPKGSSRAGSPGGKAGSPDGKQQQATADDDSEDEFGDIIDSNAKIETLPRKQETTAEAETSNGETPVTASDAGSKPSSPNVQQQQEEERVGSSPGSGGASSRKESPRTASPNNQETSPRTGSPRKESPRDGGSPRKGSPRPVGAGSPKDSPRSGSPSNDSPRTKDAASSKSTAPPQGSLLASKQQQDSPRGAPPPERKHTALPANAAEENSDDDLDAIVDAAPVNGGGDAGTTRRHRALHGTAEEPKTADRNASPPPAAEHQEAAVVEEAPVSAAAEETPEAAPVEETSKSAAAPPPEEESSSDDEPIQHAVGSVPIRQDHAADVIRKQRTIITKKDEKGIAPKPSPIEEEEPSSDEEEVEDVEDASEPPLKEQHEEDLKQEPSPKKKDPSKRASLMARGGGGQGRGEVVDEVTVRVTGWIREARSSALMAPPLESEHAQRISKRQSLAPGERNVPLPYSSQLILHILHNARVSNSELSQFVFDFLSGVLYDEVLKHTRHYGMWVRVLLHVIDELVLYYYPSEEDLGPGYNIDELEAEQQYFASTLGEIIKEKDREFSEHQQLNGDHIKYLLENALHRQLQPPGFRPQQRWEIDETDEDREDRIFLHAMMILDCAVALQQLVALASDRVDSMIQYNPAEAFSFAKRTQQEEGQGQDEIVDIAPSTSSFLFSVSKNHARKLLYAPAADSKTEHDGKRQQFSTELGASGWLPTLLTELNALYIQLSNPQPVNVGSTSAIMKQAAVNSNVAIKKASPRAHGLIVEVFRSIFFNINTSLVNRMHHRVAVVEETEDDSGKKNKKKSNGKTYLPKKSTDDKPPSTEVMHLRSARDAMNLKLTVSALEQWLTDHDLYSECRKELLQLRQICDLFILPKSIFVDIRTRIDVCGLISEELMFHGLHQFVKDEKEIVPDDVPGSLLDSLAQSIAARKGIRLPEETTGKGRNKDQTKPRTLVDEVATQVPIPVTEPLPLDFVLVHVDNVIHKYKEASKGLMQKHRNEESRAIQDSLEWDVMSH